MAERVTVGDVFGRWTVVEHLPNGTYGVLFKCRCVCGKERDLHRYVLLRNRFGKCVCSRSEAISVACSQKNATHGETRKHGGKPEYWAWLHMIKRCSNPNDNRYNSYGARGIMVCDRWRHSFENFLEDVGRRPSPDLSIDRIDNNGNYEPGNVRWATRQQQQWNMRHVRMLTANGETFPMAEWARRKGVSSNRISRRIKQGWSEEDAILTPFTRRR